MSEQNTSCSHDCSSCSQDCGERERYAKLNDFSQIGRVIAVGSGKGGVGKSTVTALLAVLLSRQGYRVGILDADVTGPSIPKAFGLHEKTGGSAMGIVPAQTSGGIRVMSINLLLENETQPVVWRGPVLAGAVTQFWTDVAWGELDVLLIDMPPGTGDIPLTIYQSLPVDATVIVSTPQSLVRLVVEKARQMAAMLQIPVLGLVENMSYVCCPDCGKHIPLFGEAPTDADYGLPVLARLPLDAQVVRLCDEGRVEEAACPALADAVAAVKTLLDTPKQA